MTTKILQNGSDIRGIALSGVPGETPNLGEAEAISLTRGYLLWLSDKVQKSVSQLKIAVGMDSRISGPALKQYLAKTISKAGAVVFDCGLASTPAMFMSTIFDETLCDGAIMITASHLPFNRNGFKYFDKNGGLNKADIKLITELADEVTDLNGKNIQSVATSSNKGQIIPFNLMDIYASHLKQLIIDGANNGEKPLEGIKIIVDAGNGGGGFYASKVLEPLGADVSDSQYLEPDGTFPNHAPNPEDKIAMASICGAVKERGADFGLIFDTDVDRSAAVDGKGNPISRNEIVALAAALLAEEYPGTTIVTDSITSIHLKDFIENTLGLKHLRYKRGYKNVINKSIELNTTGTDSQLAIETSGHAAFKENYFLDDGAYLATKIVIKAALLNKEGRTLDSLISQLKKPAESIEVRMKLLTEDFSSYGDTILNELKAYIKEYNHTGISLEDPNYEGVRINFDDTCGNGWALIRKSLHDPIMPLNIESDKADGCSEIASFLKKFLEKYTYLDISGM